MKSAFRWIFAMGLVGLGALAHATQWQGPPAKSLGLCVLLDARIDAASHAALRDAGARFLSSTTGVTKTFFDQEAYAKLGGAVLAYAPALSVSIMQPWMRVPLKISVSELRITGSGPSLRSWVLKEDGGLLELTGGRLELLSAGAERLLCER